MSLPWSKVIRLRVTPDEVSGSLIQRWLDPKVLARTCQAPSAAPGTQGVSADSIHAKADTLARAIEAALAELAKTSQLRGARLEVEWANELMTFDVVAGEFEGNSDAQLQSVATACLSELLGDAVQAHDIRWQLQSDRRHLLIGAIASDYLQLLSQSASRHGLRLCSVEPDFCLQWNRHAGTVRAGTSVFAVASGHDAMIACVSNGAVIAISSGAWVSGSRRKAGADSAAPMRSSAAEPAAGENLLDVRLARLLASVGLDPADRSDRVLVATEWARENVSSGWTVLNRDAIPA